jgi:hypothetical protein
MNRTATHIAAAITIGFACVSNDAKAEAGVPVDTLRASAKQNPVEVEQAHNKTAGGQTFFVNGRRVLVPSDANSEAVIKALKARYPALRSDALATRLISAGEKTNLYITDRR